MKNAKQFIFFLIFNFLISGIINGHPWKPDHYVIIDTDCGLDDFRAINLMLASSNIRVLAIITSNGVLNAEDGYFKVKDLLRNNYNEGILVGANQNLLSHARDCKAAIDFVWGNENDQYQMDMVLYSDVLNQVFQNCNEKIVFVNMGSLNTINSYLMNNSSQIDQIKEIIWTCNYEKLTESFKLQEKANRRKEKADAEAKQIPNFKNLNIPYYLSQDCKNISIIVIDILNNDKKAETKIDTVKKSGTNFIIEAIICPICGKTIQLNKHWNCFMCKPGDAVHKKAMFDIKKVVEDASWS